jgi:catechol 2,3-dioxygenase-like lactoylglutathione lyase family enzyme
MTTTSAVPATAPGQQAPLTPTLLHGVHHTARPTWKLQETVRFYRDVLGLPIVHAISARGWGPETHPDFLHFFFGSGNDSTIAFFYYIGTDCPERMRAEDSWLYKSVHTAWRVETREEMLAWKTRLEGHGYDVLQVRHELIESIYVTDPNGYMVEFTWQVRPMNDHDAQDATLTIQAALESESGGRLGDIDTVWRRKAELVRALLTEGSAS